MDGWKMNFLSGWPIFRGYVKLWWCMSQNLLLAKPKSVSQNFIMNMIGSHVSPISWGPSHVQITTSSYDHLNPKYIHIHPHPSPPLCSKPTCRIVAALSILIETRIFFSQSLEATRGEDVYEDDWRWMSFWRQDGCRRFFWDGGADGMGLWFFCWPTR